MTKIKELLLILKNYIMPKKKDETEDVEIQNDEIAEDNLKNINSKPPNVTAFKKKYVKGVIFFALSLVVVSIVWGLTTERQKKKDRANQIKTETTTSTTPEIGEHLTGIPSKYNEVPKEKQEKQEKQELKNVDPQYKKNNTSDALPQVPKAPPRPTQPQQLQNNYEEKRKIQQYEIKQKALESPIGFDLKRGEN